MFLVFEKNNNNKEYQQVIRWFCRSEFTTDCTNRVLQVEQYWKPIRFSRRRINKFDEWLAHLRGTRKNLDPNWGRIKIQSCPHSYYFFNRKSRPDSKGAGRIVTLDRGGFRFGGCNGTGDRKAIGRKKEKRSSAASDSEARYERSNGTIRTIQAPPARDFFLVQNIITNEGKPLT
jgi:hypothetical protein